MVAQFLFSLSRGRAIFREISTEMDVKTVTIIVKLRLEMKSKCSIFFFHLYSRQDYRPWKIVDLLNRLWLYNYTYNHIAGHSKVADNFHK